MFNDVGPLGCLNGMGAVWSGACIVLELGPSLRGDGAVETEPVPNPAPPVDNPADPAESPLEMVGIALRVPFLLGVGGAGVLALDFRAGGESGLPSSDPESHASSSAQSELD